MLSYHITLLYLLHIYEAAGIEANPDTSVVLECVGSCQGAAEQSRSVRLEYIKSQILKKLKLKSPPRVTTPSLPELLSEKLTSEIENQDGRQDFAREDFYGKTHQVIIFPNESTVACPVGNSTRESACYQFHLTKDLSTRNITSAELWFIPNRISNSTTTYTVTDHSLEPIDGNSTDKYPVLAVEDSENISVSGWLKFDLTEAVRLWIESEHFEQKLTVTRNNEFHEEQAVNSSQEPFLIIRTDPREKPHSRKRRNLNCTPSTTVCCKEHFHVSFKDIGWNHWVIKPDSYDANYCRGECLMDVSAARYFHTTILQEYIQSNAAMKNNFTITLCCTPARMRPLTMIYMTEERHIYKKVLPNMIAESCDCA